MPYTILYWALMIALLATGICNIRSAEGPRPIGYMVLIFALLVMVGWRIFGAPVVK